MSNQFRDNGGYIPGLGYVHLKAGEHIVNHLIDAFMAIEAKRKRQPIVKVEKHSEWGDGKGAWAWDCPTCAYTGYHPTWENAYYQANRHAHNHHGEKR